MLAAAVVRRLRGNAVPLLRYPHVPYQRAQHRLDLHVQTRQSSWKRNSNSNSSHNRDDSDRSSRSRSSKTSYRSNSERDSNPSSGHKTQPRPSNPFSWITSRSNHNADRSPPRKNEPRRTPRIQRRPTKHLDLPSSKRKARAPFDLSNPTIAQHPGTLVKETDTLLSYRNSGQPVPEQESIIDRPGLSSHFPMLTWVQIASVPTADTPGAHVIMHFDNRHYLFGQVAEGAQRNMVQRRMGLSKLDELFITGPVMWKNVGGLMGMILTIADVVAAQNETPDEHNQKKKKRYHELHGDGIMPSLKIYGAENLNYMLATARRFIFRKGLPLRIHEIEHEDAPAEGAAKERKPDFEDSNIRVWYVSLMPEGAAEVNRQSRKRSHDDMVSESDPQSKEAKDAKDRREAKNLVKSVVNNMFDSEWELDALVQTMLHDVKLPATVFVKGDDGKPKKYEGPLPGGKEEVTNIPVLVRNPWPATKIQDLPPASPSPQSLSYIVKGHTRRGKFKPETALKHGVPKQFFKKLTAGQTVKGSDGQDVTPEMCLEPSIEGRGFAFIDLPDVSYIPSFLARPEWTDVSVMETLDVFYWNLGRGVAHDERLLAFMREHSRIWHNVFSPDTNPNRIALQSASAQVIAMNCIDPDRFAIPVFNRRPKTPTGSSKPPYDVSTLGSRWQIAPRTEKQDDELVKDLNPAEFSIRTSARKAVAQAKKTLADPNFHAMIERTESDIPHRDLEVIPLGTGSALPSKYRNVSATLIRIPGIGAYLFDCGENTIGQIRRMYGYQRAEEILAELKCIWISHLHADHHLGLASIIRAWHEATTPRHSTASPTTPLPRLTVASHWHMTNWLREYSQIEDIGLHRVNLINISGPHRPETVQHPIVFHGRDAVDSGLERIDAVRVDHCYGALACVFTWPSGLKIAYSGDCRPSNVFAEVGADCTLLLHEATLDDELRGDALVKKHCTISEAVGVARRMRARRVLLTHFSQRYPKIGNWRVDEKDGPGVEDQVTLMAFDHMCVKLGDFKKAELFLPALRNFLEDTIDED